MGIGSAPRFAKHRSRYVLCAGSLWMIGACSGKTDVANTASGGSANLAGASASGNGGVDATASGGAGAPSGGESAAGAGNASAEAGAAGAFDTSCDDIGSEPMMPDACATLVATKTIVDGVPSDETTLDTQAIQAAINACPAGQAVKLTSDPDNTDNTAFVSGPLSLRNGVSLWIDTGTTLFASRNPRDFDAKPNACGTNNGGGSACYALINVSGVSQAGVVGEGTLDGRGGEVVTGGTSTWWDLENAYAGKLAAPRLIQTNGGSAFTLYKVRLQNSPKFHVVIDSTVGFVVWGITIFTPPDSPNTDGIDPSAATNGVIAYNTISTGDDNIAIKGAGPPIVDNVVIAHNHFGRGHGMSIGSETYGGVQNVRVCDLSLDGTSNGIRIKSDVSRGGLVQNVSYTDICMRGVKDPLVFNPYYSTATGTLIPNFRDIFLKNVHDLDGGKLTFTGYDSAHPLGISLDNVVFDGSLTIVASQANVTLGGGPVNFMPSGDGVTVTDHTTNSDPPKVCDDAWVTFN